MTDTQLGAYQWALDWMADIDPYSGLIVSMHRTGLWKGRYDTIEHPAWRYNLTTLSPAVQAFIARNEAWQERSSATLDAKGVWTNYRLMQVWSPSIRIRSTCARAGSSSASSGWRTADSTTSWRSGAPGSRRPSA